MTNLRFALVSLGLLVACGDDGGKTTPAADAPANVPAMVTVTGTAAEISASGRVPQGDVMIAAYKEGADNTPIAMTTSMADGTYSLSIPTGGVALEGYLLGKKASFKDTYLYPPASITADLAGATVLLLKPGTYDLVPTIAQAAQDPGMGFIAMMIVDSAQMPVAGVTITSSPAGIIRYNKDGLPNKTATATEADGIAYVLNVPPGTVSLNAMKTGSTFHGHDLNARADQVTTTLIQ